MINRIVQPIRKHLHVLLIVPLAIIATTWPTFPRIFDRGEFWLHVVQHDKWLKIWDAWHIERVLGGQAQLYFTDSFFHPQGLSLAYQAYVFPHAFLLIALKAVIPVDDAYNLLFLLILCFNAFCGYALIRHLIKDKWIALFGAVIFAVATPFPFGSTSADHIMIGTLPLTVFFLLRAFSESNWRLGAIAGICAGVTAFISVYVFAIILLSVGILASMKAFSLWRRGSFWRSLLLFAVLCFSVSMLRFYPMLADRALLTQAVETYQGKIRSNDVLQHFVLPNNPITGHLFGEPIDPRKNFETSIIKLEFREAYLGYINIFLAACAFLLQPRRRRLLPWTVILVFFAVLRLGSFLTFNGAEYTEIILPEGFLRGWFPTLFGVIGNQEYYQIGVVMALAVLSCCGLAALLRSKQAKFRMFAVLLCTLVICIEFYVPRVGQTIEKEKTAFVAWLQSEPASPVKLIHLPLTNETRRYFHFIQTLTGYPQAFGFSNRQRHSTRQFIEDNLLLNSWDRGRSVHCLPHNEQSFVAALERLLAEGFTHVVVHNWLYGDQFIIHTFRNTPAAYVDEYVSVYRVSELRQSCSTKLLPLPHVAAFADSPAVAPGPGSAILSYHSSEGIDANLLNYLGSLFSDWRSFVRVHWENDQPVIQSAGLAYTDMDAIAGDNQLVYLVYDASDADPPTALDANSFLAEFELCQRDSNNGRSMIDHYVSRDYSCALVTSGNPLRVQYDNGARLENVIVQADQDVLDLQFMWSSLPEETHSISIQLFDATGAKLFGQDAVIAHATLDRHYINISDLEPGQYEVRLIVYSFVTGKTVGGTVTASGARFDRELAIADLNHI